LSAVFSLLPELAVDAVPDLVVQHAMCPLALTDEAAAHRDQVCSVVDSGKAERGPHPAA
jgi:hypothetical protein